MVTADGLGPGGRAGGGPEDSEEHELRVLLERAVPQLAAPNQRLERVRERVRRRRRRRTAGVCAVLVAAIGTTGLLLPRGGGAGAGTVEPGAAPPPAATSPTPTSPTPTSLTPSWPPATESRPPSPLARFTDPALTLPVPRDWQSLATYGTVYLSSGPLAETTPPCGDPLNGYCLPLRDSLAPGGVLLVLQVQHNPTLANKADRLRALSPYPLGKSCRAEGGTEQWYVLVRRATRPAVSTSAVLTGSACLARPTDSGRRTVRDLLTSADFS